MKHRLLRLLSCASVLLVASGCDEAASSTNPLAHEYTQAADALIAKVGAPGEKSEMPAATDPAVQAFDAQAQKAMAALGTTTLPVDGFQTFEPLCLKSANIVGAYVNAGQSGAAANQELMGRNMERYFAQMFTPLLFSAHCSAAHVPFFEETVDTKDESKAAAVKQVRDGGFAQFSGLIQMASAGDISPDHRRRVMDVLVRDAGNFALLLSEEQRQQVTASAQNARAALGENEQKQIDAIISAVAKAPCGKLCSA